MTKHFVALSVWVSVKVCDRERNQPIRIHGTVSSPNIIEILDEGGSITQVRWSFGAFADTFNRSNVTESSVGNLAAQYIPSFTSNIHQLKITIYHLKNLLQKQG